MILTANNLPILAARLLRPRVGLWTLDLTVDDEDGIGLTGTVSVVLGALTLAGTVVVGEVLPDGVWSGRVVGGAGGLGRTAPALALRSCTLADVLDQTLADAGEVADSGSLDLSDRSVARWNRVAAPASRAVADVARAASCDWRVTPGGAVWLGVDTWTTETPAEVTLIEVHPITQAVTVAGDAAVTIAPGTTLDLDGWSPVRVGATEVTADAEAVRVVVYPEREGGTGRVLDAFRALVRETQPVDRFALYPSRIVSQRADGSLDLVPDDPRVASCQAVPIRLGIPGVTVEVSSGARVLLGFEAGDPSKPVATLWDAATVTRITINSGTRDTARRDDATDDGTWRVLAVTVPGSPPTTDLYLLHTPPGAASPVGVKVAGLPGGVTVGALSGAPPAGGETFAQVGKINGGTDVVRVP